MRFRKWVLSPRQKRVLRNLGLVLGALLAIGIFPPTLFVFLVLGIGYGLFKLIMRIRRSQSETRTY